MAYIGRSIDKLSNIEKLDTITFDGSSSYTLQKNSVNFTPNSANSLQVSIDGVVQAGNFTVSGSTIDFGVAIPSTSTNDFIFHYGTGLITTPADGTVSLDKLSATGTKDATTFLRGDNTFAEAGGGIEMVDQFRLTADYTWSSPGNLTANLERVDGTNQGTLGTGMSESSGVFTFPSTGIYLVRFSAQQYKNGDRRDIQINITTTSDNSSYANIAECITHITQSSSGTTYIQGMTETILDITDTSNQKVRFAVFTDATTAGSSTKNKTFMTFIRLGDT